MRTVVVNCDAIDKPGTSGYYVERACRSLGFKTYRPDNHPKEVDLVINIEPCYIYRAAGAPSVYWEIDSYLHKGGNQDHYTQADLVFIGTNPKEITQYAYPKGKTIFLPVAADPKLHRPYPSDQPFDLVFVGRIDGGYGGRREVLDRLSERYQVKISQANPGREYSQAMSQGKLIFNKNTGLEEINSRFYEGMAIGALVTNYVPEMDKLAKPHVHYIPYSDDLEEQIDRYLADPDARAAIARNGRQLVLKRHTWAHRVKSILAYVAMLPFL